MPSSDASESPVRSMYSGAGSAGVSWSVLGAVPAVAAARAVAAAVPAAFAAAIMTVISSMFGGCTRVAASSASVAAFANAEAAMLAAHNCPCVEVGVEMVAVGGATSVVETVGQSGSGRRIETCQS